MNKFGEDDMRIAILIDDLNIRGGTHKQVLRLYEYLVGQGNSVIIYTKDYNKGKTYPEFEKCQIVVLPKLVQSSSKIVGLGKILNFFRKNKVMKAWLDIISKDADVINVHEKGFERFMLYARKKSALKIIWQINDLPGCFLLGTHKKANDSFNMKKQRVVYRLIAKCVDEITVNVTKNAERVKQCFGRDAKVFYCGVDVNENLEKHIYAIKDNTIKILSSGVFFPYRNYETLVAVVEDLKNKNVNVHLDVIGATDRAPVYSEEIINLVKEKQLENEITIWGQVDDAKYNELHNQADVFAFINIDQSWGLAVFEAMSCGLPVIVSESVGAIELLHHDEDAIIVDPENVEAISGVVLKLMNDKDYYNKISENAYNAVKEFTWDKLYSEKMLELFKNKL